MSTFWLLALPHGFARWRPHPVTAAGCCCFLLSFLTRSLLARSLFHPLCWCVASISLLSWLSWNYHDGSPKAENSLPCCRCVALLEIGRQLVGHGWVLPQIVCRHPKELAATVMWGSKIASVCLPPSVKASHLPVRRTTQLFWSSSAASHS